MKFLRFEAEVGELRRLLADLIREVVSGSGRSAQKSEKLAYFEPISEPQGEEKIGIFSKKCGIFLIRKLQFL